MKIVPASHGFNWLRVGWLLFMRNPLIWILAFSAYWLMFAVASQIPFLGLILNSLLMPAFAVGFMSLGAAAEAGRPLEPALLFYGFKQRLQSLITLGGVYLIASCVFLLLLYFFLQQPAPVADAQSAAQTLNVSAAGLAVLLLLSVLVMMAFWFSPVLAAWHAMAPAKSLFFSFFACLRNWRAFLVYGLTLLLFFMGAILLSSALFGIFFKSAGAETIPLQQFMLAFVLGLVPMLIASLYASYRDIFGSPPPGALPTVTTL